ncbi:adenylyltransferase [Xylaria sp. CBS 124048]|nr:adenylyltransferase [Xylaria sp. CBS 124048]
MVTNKIEQLRTQILKKEEELRQLRTQLDELEAAPPETPAQHQSAAIPPGWKWPLREEEYTRYGRQLILPSVGIKGQLRLKSAAVLVIGAGGLGCPAAAYLAGAGVGTLGVVDGDTVEVSNLHRQIAHSTVRVGWKKVHSLVEYCKGLNPEIKYVTHDGHLTPENAEDIVGAYDVVLDCTDHPTSRYLISDICVLLGKPLVSASALRTDGQLIVLNNPPAAQGSAHGGPCYRCVFPKPPPADSVVSCGEGGILGPVVGVMGVLQALEAVKLVSAGIARANGSVVEEPAPTSLLLFSANSPTPFRSVRMRNRRATCFACSAASSLTLKGLRSGSLDYVQFCGVAASVDLLQPDERISATHYNSLLASKEKNILLDVREKEHFDIASIPGAINIPYSTFQHKSKSTPDGDASHPSWLPADVALDVPIYVVCRVGENSQLATKQLKEMGLARSGARFIGDIKGGMKAWKREVDQTTPFT